MKEKKKSIDIDSDFRPSKGQLLNLIEAKKKKVIIAHYYIN